MAPLKVFKAMSRTFTPRKMSGVIHTVTPRTVLSLDYYFLRV